MNTMMAFQHEDPEELILAIMCSPYEQMNTIMISFSYMYGCLAAWLLGDPWPASSQYACISLDRFQVCLFLMNFLIK